MPDIKIGSEGVLKTLSRYSPEKSIAEYVWNGFDAGASEIKIEFSANEIGNIPEILITDNGSGINYDRLNKKFSPFMESEKLKAGQKRTVSDVHGKNGVGRLSFISFALSAEWKTVYESDDKKTYEYSLIVKKPTANHYETPEKPSVVNKRTGTQVELSGLFNLNEAELEDRVKNYLVKDFCWYLELNKRQKKIYINGEELTYDDFLLDKDVFALEHKPTGTKFEVEFYQWRENLNEYSKHYYIDAEGAERHKENTSFNNKGDGFYHSVIVKSPYFDDFDFNVDEDDKPQLILAKPSKRDPQFKFLKTELNELLRRKRYPYLDANAQKLIEDLEATGAIPEYDSNDSISSFVHTSLVDTLKEFYKLEPKLFQNLNSEQKVTFTRFLNLALENGGRADLFKIIESVINLSDDERAELSELLNGIGLNRIIKTTKMLEDRRATVEDLKKLVFDASLYAKETPHLQDVIQSNCWIFGEEYNLVVAEDKAFDAALRQYRLSTDGAKPEGKVEHPDKNKQVDVFATRRRLLSANGTDSVFENIIIELKSPDVKLGKKELDQVEKYMRLIKNTAMFNSKKAKWTFILVGNELAKTRTESTPYIQDKIDSNESQGKDIAIHDKNNDYVIKVKTWSTVFDEFDIRHNFIYENLQREQQELTAVEAETTAVDLTANINSRSVATPPTEEQIGKAKRPKVTARVI